MMNILTAELARAIAEDVLNNNLSKQIVEINTEITLAAKDGKTHLSHHWYARHELSQLNRVVNFFEMLGYTVTTSPNNEWLYFNWAD